MTRIFVTIGTLVLASGAALAHHGWGSYDAANPITVAGSIVSSKFENPHATISVRGRDKVWTVTLAPTSRMVSRGANASVVAVGKNVSAYGYASTVKKASCARSASPSTASPTNCADEPSGARDIRRA